MSEAKALRNSALQPGSRNAPWPTLDLCTDERTSGRVHTAWIKMYFIRSHSICYTIPKHSVSWRRCAMWKGVKIKTEMKLLSQLWSEKAVILLLPTACQELWGTKKEPLLKYKLSSSPNNRITFETADDHFNPRNSDELECLTHTLCQHVILEVSTLTTEPPEPADRHRTAVWQKGFLYCCRWWWCWKMPLLVLYGGSMSDETFLHL